MMLFNIILKHVCLYYDTRKSFFMNRHQTYPHVNRRHMAWAIMRHFGRTYKEIGGLTGHTKTNVYQSIRNLLKEMEVNHVLFGEYQHLVGEVNQSLSKINNSSRQGGGVFGRLAVTFQRLADKYSA